jgi:small subunit ribosomal protein S20
MPIKNAAIKDLRQNIKRAAHNQKIKSDIAALIRKTKKAMTAKDSAKAADWLKQSIKKIDKAVVKKILKKNTAARMKSRLSKAVSAVVKKK